MWNFAPVEKYSRAMILAARELALPVLATEQYPKGLGPTVPELAGLLGAVPSKLTFSSGGCPEFAAALQSLGRTKVLVCGIEAHICVLQTSLDLLARGFEVYLLIDCITSRRLENKQAALARLTQAGVIPATLEMALFEMMRTADAPQFKAIQNLIK